ncbi:EGF domain-containing protein [Oryctes borbonicus]|uniref:EGF domain-containing protein n=1 Tax=Oryctes borbonicus TaxID=1629725 RepID=A0A0T6AVH0_9SCAR|nr:EGF domain-containing protein [Oryctes borbonicus]
MDTKTTLSFLFLLLLQHAKSDIYGYSECNNPLMNRAKLTATSYLSNRGPENAVLYGKKTWTAADADLDQHLIIDLGQIMNITRIWTQGRSHTSDYVVEYIVSYGTDNLDYSFYKEPGGSVRMFKGNSDGDSIKKNEFEVPIIAQWIRINPTRWRNRISLRVELFGCEYDSEILHFNGSSLVKRDLRFDPISAFRETIRFRFKTSMANGVLLYSRGTQKDYIALQLKDNRMLLNIDLGSQTVTSLSVGSLLDNNIWHDVVVSRNRRIIYFSVDRVVVEGKIQGDFNKLDLNRALYIGGVPYIQEGIKVLQNFTGCIENLYLNSTNLFRDIKEAQDYGPALHYQLVNTYPACAESPIIPLTFTTSNAHIKYAGYSNIHVFQVYFQFRTYEKNGVMLYHHFNLEESYVAIYLENGKIKVDLASNAFPRLILDNYQITYNDGLWHTVEMSIHTNELILSVDKTPMKTTRLLEVKTGLYYYVAGGIDSNIGLESDKKIPGFIGCMRSITIDGNIIQNTNFTMENCKRDCKEEVVQGMCKMDDRCDPNPCEHGGICTQNSKNFECECSNDYGGSVCHISLNALSCEAFKNIQATGPRAEVNIDIDGSGPLDPFPVTCEFYADGRIATVLHHNNQGKKSVDGFQNAGSYEQDIHYDANYEQIEALVNRSTTCRQSIQYDCKNSRLFNSPSEEGNYQPFSWWVSRNNQKMDYWGGALPGSRKCQCGLLGKCIDPTKWCNCDAGLPNWTSDSGEISEKENLPVKQLRFGDTGNALDDKEGRYILGPLICEGDDLFKNVVTFRIRDATIDLPPFDMGHSGDIYFEFRTTINDAVIFESRGPTDMIKLNIINGRQLQFEYRAGENKLVVTSETTYYLTDNKWHSVSVERNRKSGMIIIDGSRKAEVSDSEGPVRALHLPNKFVLGASYDYRDGFTGCIRAFQLNGKLIDLRSYARAGIYGITEGCVGKCESNPCLNNGTCQEMYNGYRCDCRFTSFKGPICADEIGVNLRKTSMIKYKFEGSFRSTLAEKIRIGFTTTHPNGFLLGFSSSKSKEYLTIMISNSGHLRVVFDFGFERQEVIYPDKIFMFGQFHDLKLSRKNAGSILVLKMDDYDPVEFKFTVKASADAQFNNIEYMYIGRNESMSEGFVGCVARVEFDDIYPLKLLFQQSRPANIYTEGPTAEDYCGVEPVTHPPDIVETRPPLILDEEKLRQAYNQTDSAILGSVLAILFLALVILAVIIGRYLHRHKGEYLTQEDLGADNADDPDTAVVLGTTGHHVEKKKEYYI